MNGRYREYQDRTSREELAGVMLPVHWGTTKVRYVTTCLDGKRVPLNGTERGEKQGDVPYWGANSIVDYVDEALFDESLALLGEDGAPFFDSTKDVAFVSHGKIWPNNHVHVLRPNSKIDLGFLVHSLNSVDYRLYIKGSTRDKLNQSNMSDIGLAFPPLAEQKTIARFLDHETAKIDQLIAKQERLIELLKEKRQAVISHAVTRGLNPTAKTKDSGAKWMGEVPEHWLVAGFKKYLNKIVDYRGKTPEKTDSGVFLVTARNIKNGAINYEASQEYISEDDYEDVMRRGKPKLGHLLFTTEAPLGEVAIIDREDIALAQRIIKFDGKSDVLSNTYLKYLIQSDQFQQSLETFATGSTALGIKAERLVYLKALIPPINEQREIVDYVDLQSERIDALKVKATDSIQLMKERRSALISAAVTGKIDVREWQPECATTEAESLPV